VVEQRNSPPSGTPTANPLRDALWQRSVRPALIASRRTILEYPTFLAHLLIGLADESIPVSLICPSGFDIEGIVSGPIEVIKYPAINLPFIDTLSLSTLTGRLEKFKPTVLHCLCESKAAFVRRLAEQLNLPYILTVNSLSRRISISAASPTHCAKIVVPAKTIASHVRKMLPRFADRVQQINIGTFVDETIECFDDPSRLPSMVTAHPLDSVDDFRNLFTAVKNLTADGYEFMLIVMGVGRAENSVWRLLAQMNILQDVILVPRLNPPRSVLAAADIFIQPQPSMSFNLSLLEAMSLGTAAAVCTGGVDDLIIPEKTAVVFDPREELSVRSVLRRLLDKHNFARELAKTSQQYVKDNHSVSKMIEQVLHLWQSTAGSY